jgi:lysophospholipase L1-like esterase
VKCRSFRKACFIALAVIPACCIAMELGARVRQERSTDRVNAGNLHPYQQVDPENPANWVLRPGFSATLKDLIEKESKESRLDALEKLSAIQVKWALKADDVVLRVNDSGYLGPDLDPEHHRARVLVLGDSCTFSRVLKDSYPQSMSAELQSHGKEVEVINAAVEGYQTQNLIQRLNEFKALKPEVTLIYIGWGGLFNTREDPSIHWWTPRSIWLLSAIKGRLFPSEAADASLEAKLRRIYARPKHPAADSEEVTRLSSYTPSFMGDLRRLGREMSWAGSRVVVITLPGLYRTGEAISPKALQLGHLPEYTDNPYVLAQMVERYNVQLREEARKHGWVVADLEAWSRTALQPRDQFFRDTVHINSEGKQLIGKFLALQILPLLQEPRSGPKLIK